MDWLDQFWADLLSEQPLRIVAAWVRLDSDEQQSVREHLTRMTTEDGWADGQRSAAQAALSAIQGGSHHDGPDEESAAPN